MNPLIHYAPLVAINETDDRTRYAAIISGLDADGKPRCLALTWDGVWHPINPATGNVLIAAGRLDPGMRCRRSNGGEYVRRDMTMLMSSPAQVRLHASMDPMANMITVRASELVEVLP
jgi:hypothetical protein